MNQPDFPDGNVVLYIESLAREFSMEVLSRSCSGPPNTSASSINSSGQRWEWQLGRSGGSVRVGISIGYPSYITIVFLENTNSDATRGKRTHFFLEKYLSKNSKYIRDQEAIETITLEKSWATNWRVPLEILKEHLRSDLAPIIEGKEWPNIDFRLEDYVEPQAAGRLYEIQKEVADERPGAWMYILNLFRRK